MIVADIDKHPGIARSRGPSLPPINPATSVASRCNCLSSSSRVRFRAAETARARSSCFLRSAFRSCCSLELIISDLLIDTSNRLRSQTIVEIWCAGKALALSQAGGHSDVGRSSLAPRCLRQSAACPQSGLFEELHRSLQAHTNSPWTPKSRRQVLFRPSLGLSVAGLASRDRSRAGGNYDAGSFTSDTPSTRPGFLCSLLGEKAMDAIRQGSKIA